MPKKSIRTSKKRNIVHFFTKRLFIVLFLVFGICVVFWYVVAPYADTNPIWEEPVRMSAAFSPSPTIHGVTDVPARLIFLTKDSTSSEILVNGKSHPVMYLRPGQTVRLEVINATTDKFNLFIPGYHIYVFSRNNSMLDELVESNSEHIPSGRKTQLLFTPKWYGKISVGTLPYDEGVREDVQQLLFTIQVQGLPMIPSPLPITLAK